MRVLGILIQEDVSLRCCGKELNPALFIVAFLGNGCNLLVRYLLQKSLINFVHDEQSGDAIRKINVQNSKIPVVFRHEICYYINKFKTILHYFVKQAPPILLLISIGLSV